MNTGLFTIKSNILGEPRQKVMTISTLIYASFIVMELIYNKIHDDMSVIAVHFENVSTT